MPELPEVEVVRLSLEAYLTGKRIQKIEILNKKSFIGNPRLVEGQKIIKFSRIENNSQFTLAMAIFY